MTNRLKEKRHVIALISVNVMGINGIIVYVNKTCTYILLCFKIPFQIRQGPNASHLSSVHCANGLEKRLGSSEKVFLTNQDFKLFRCSFNLFSVYSECIQ